MYRKTIIATIMLLVAAIALSVAVFGAARNCYRAMKQPGAAPVSAAKATLQNDAQTATVEIDDKGFEPSNLKLKAGAPAKVTFVRKTDATCAKEVVIKEYKIERKLPLNEPVTVEFTPRKGEFTFACGMGMIKGKLIVE
jgi:plastocyanin domain-containing protein